MSTLRTVLDSISDVEATIADIERSQIGRPSFATELSLKSLQQQREMLDKELAQLTASQQVDVCDYRLISSEGNSYPLSGVTKALHEFQDLVSIVYDAIVNKPKQKASISADIAAKTRFDFGFAYPGSLGVVLTIPNERLLAVDSELDKALKEVFEMLRIRSPESVKQTVERFGVAAVKKLHDMTKAHTQFGLSADIKWVRDDSIRDQVIAQLQEMEVIRGLIEARGDVISESVSLNARLVAWSVPQRSFTLEYGDAPPISGRWSDDFEDTQEKTVPSFYSARLTKTTTVRYVADDLVAWKLEELQSSSE